MFRTDIDASVAGGAPEHPREPVTIRKGKMKNGLRWLSDITGGLGMALCGISGVARVLGHYVIGNIGSMTIFTAGTGLMVAACLIKLQGLESRG